MTTVNDESEFECAVCSTGINEDDVIITVSGGKICIDCSITCERCSDTHTNMDDFNEVDGNIWCHDCAVARANYCDYCDDYTMEYVTRLGDRRESWCSDALDNAYWCEYCDTYFADGCDEGHGDDEPDSRVVHDYNYRPDALFHGARDEKLYFGIEIEVEAGDKIHDASNYAYRLEDMGLAYLKSDGSLNCGFEVVSHPLSHHYWKNEATEFFDTMENLRSNADYKVKSWDTKTCGLHIHVSRAGFTNGIHMHRFLNLIYSNQELYEALAGRSSDRWAKFDDVAYMPRYFDTQEQRWVNGKVSRSFMSKINHGRSTDRYSAVNTQNSATLEIRIFRGTINSNTIKAHLDLAHASVEYTRVMSIPEVRDGALNPARFIEYIKANEVLYPELVARLAKVWKESTHVGISRQETSI